MKKTLSILLSIMMLLSITAGLDFSAYADDFTNPQSVSVNGSAKEGNINENNTDDIYKFVVPNDGTVTISLMSYGSLKYMLYDSDKTTGIDVIKVDGTANSPNSKSGTYDLSKGTYYIKLCAYDTYMDGIGTYVYGKYKVNIKMNSFGNNETEPNDFDHAMSLPADKTVTGALTIQDNVDWYKITVTAKCRIKVVFSYYLGDVHYAFYNTYNNILNECIDSVDLDGGKADTPKSVSGTYNLPAGTYYVKISQSYNYTGKYKFVWSYNVDVPTPSSLKVSARKTTSLKLTWSKVSGSNGYQLQQYKGNKWTTIKTANINSYTVSKLKAGTSYKFRVRAYKTFNGKTYYSGWKSITTPTKPAATAISSLKSGKKCFTAKWKKTTCTGYQIQYSTSSKFKNAKTVTVSNNKTTSKKISKLKAKKKYYVRIRTYKTVKVNGKNTKIYSGWSKVKTVTTKK